MNILLSAYACEPNKGSEPGVGWGMAIELAKNHNVWVITRDNNRENIEKYQSENPEYNIKTLKFIYVGLSKKLTFWKKGRRGMRIFYMMWQRKAAKVAIKYNKKYRFDIVHHVTFVSYTQPTYMYKLGIPMIWGPVSGGENIPKEVKLKMSLKEKLIESIRIFSQEMALYMPSIKNTMSSSKQILVTTEETKKKIPKKYWDKTKIIPAIGLEKLSRISKIKSNNDKIRIIMVGRLIYWKAFDIGLRSFLNIADNYPNAELHILGEGKEKENLKKIAGSYLNKQVFFEKPILHDDIYEFYNNFDIFLNTTLRDSGCMAMMEAMSIGMPCIAVSSGGPKVLGKQVPNCTLINPKEYKELINEISDKLIYYINNISAINDRSSDMRQMLFSEKCKDLYLNI